MMSRIVNLSYRGQPVYRGWDADNSKRVAFWLSREIKRLPDGSWKFVRWITLRELKLDRRQAWPKIRAAIEDAERELCKMPGIKLLSGR